jgi:hypothetical protein
VVKGHSDAVDSCLYAFRESPAYAYTPPIVKPKRGSKEFEDNFAEEMFRYQIEKMQKEKDQKEGQGYNWDLDPNGVPEWNRW